MNPDKYFDTYDDFDASAIQEIEAIEAAHLYPKKIASPPQGSASQIASPLIKPTLSAPFGSSEDKLCRLDTVDEHPHAPKIKIWASGEFIGLPQSAP